jgi:hypothetical protein
MVERRLQSTELYIDMRLREPPVRRRALKRRSRVRELAKCGNRYPRDRPLVRGRTKRLLAISGFSDRHRL